MTGAGDAIRNSSGGPTYFRGVVSSLADGVLLVVTGGTAIPCANLTGYAPVVGDPVLCTRIGDGTAVCLGALSNLPRPAVVTVTAVGAGELTASDGVGGTYTLPHMTDYVPVVADVVSVSWSTHGGLVLGKRGAVTQGSAPVAQPAQGVSDTTTYPSIDAGSFRGGKWRTDSGDVVQGDWGGWGQNAGAWFYGGSLQSQLAGATVTAAAIYLPRQRGGVTASQTVHLWRHTSDTRPSGDVARVEGPFDVPSPPTNAAAWVDVPAVLVQHLIDGGPGGIGIAADPYVVLADRTSDPMTGALRIAWRR